MENNSQDWRNYGDKSIMKKDEPAKATTPRSRNGGLIALCFISLLIGAAGITLGVIALLKGGNNTNTVTTASAEGYYQGNSVEFEETSIANIVSKVTPAVVSIISESRAIASLAVAALNNLPVLA